MGGAPNFVGWIGKEHQSPQNTFRIADFSEIVTA
jgi:hypothetical protein